MSNFQMWVILSWVFAARIASDAFAIGALIGAVIMAVWFATNGE